MFQRYDRHERSNWALAESLVVWKDFALHNIRKTPQSLRPEWIAGLFFLALAILLAGLALSKWSLVVPLRPPFFALAAGLFVAAGGFLSVMLTVLARLHGPLEKRTHARN